MNIPKCGFEFKEKTCAPSPVEVGEILYFVTTDSMGGNKKLQEGQWIEVSKIGRKWISTKKETEINKKKTFKYDFYRLDLETLKADGGDYTSPGRAFRSMEDYQDWFYLEEKRNCFIAKFSRASFSKLDMETLNTIIELLGLTAEVETEIADRRSRYK